MSDLAERPLPQRGTMKMDGKEETKTERSALLTQFLLALSGEKSSVTHDSREIEVDDLVSDFRRYLIQSQFYIKNELRWPSVLLAEKGTDAVLSIGSFAPLDIEFTVINTEIPRWAEHVRGISPSFPMFGRTLQQSRQDFIDGAIDIILRRSGSLRLSGSSDHEVEITTSPSGVQVKYAQGHFFSTSLVFGTTDCKRRIKTGTWCFYRASETPHAGMPLWSITKDEKITL
jgi:hypothetical protein